MLTVGLTGGIATGKSNVLSVLGELGCAIGDADQFAHESIAPGAPAYAEVVGEFGREVLAADGQIDRARLGALVFADAARRARLEAIIHPRVYEAQARWLREVEARDPAAIAVFDAALLIETGSYRRFDKLVVVHCAPEIQLARLMSRNDLSRDEALARINAQMPSAEKLKFADYAVDTSGDFAATRRQVESLYKELRREAHERRS
jgi:dephospho-CoA kinase